jgi:hypothetical protein
MGTPTKDVVKIERFKKGVFLLSICLACRDWPVRPEQQRELAHFPNAIDFLAGNAKSFSR